jgi:type I site-specific deoxyribonuclease S subunit, restriction modification system
MKLPDGWRKVLISDAFHIQLGKMLSPNAKIGEQCPYVTNFNVRWGYFHLQQVNFMAFSEKEKEKYQLKKGDLLICEGGEIGRCAIWDKDHSGYYYQKSLHRLRPKNNLIFPPFLYHELRYLCLTRKLLNLVGESSIAHLPKEKLASVQILCPSLPEQRRIAEFLGTWDEAIEKLERLIAAKEKQQKVLSNHIFGQVKKQKFQQCRLVNICTIHKGVQLGKLKMNAEGRYPVLNGGISYSGYTDSHNCEANTIAISEGGNSCGFVNLIREKFWCGGHCYTLKNIRISMQYLFFFLKHRQDMLMNLRVGSGLPNIQKKDLENVEVVFPIMEEEQNLFSEILLCTQNELDLLRKKLAALQKQKRGLVQKLLTGTWRV